MSDSIPYHCWTSTTLLGLSVQIVSTPHILNFYFLSCRTCHMETGYCKQLYNIHHLRDSRYFRGSGPFSRSLHKSRVIRRSPCRLRKTTYETIQRRSSTRYSYHWETGSLIAKAYDISSSYCDYNMVSTGTWTITSAKERLFGKRAGTLGTDPRMVVRGWAKITWMHPVAINYDVVVIEDETKSAISSPISKYVATGHSPRIKTN